MSIVPNNKQEQSFDYCDYFEDLLEYSKELHRNFTHEEIMAALYMERTKNITLNILIESTVDDPDSFKSVLIKIYEMLANANGIITDGRYKSPTEAN